ELGSALARLVAQGLVETVGRYRGVSRCALAPAANDPVVFAGIKIRAMTEIRARIRGRLGPMADLLVAEINACSTALELRAKLRKLEDTLTKLMGQVDGAELARRIGGELTRLAPKKNSLKSRRATADSFGDPPVPARDDPEPTRRFAPPALLERRSLLLQVGRQLFRRKRLAEVVALHFVAASALEECHLVVGFDALGDDFEPQAGRHGEDRLGDRDVARIHRNAPDERRVDLHTDDRQAFQVGERGVAGPEV